MDGPGTMAQLANFPLQAPGSHKPQDPAPAWETPSSWFEIGSGPATVGNKPVDRKSFSLSLSVNPPFQQKK